MERSDPISFSVMVDSKPTRGAKISGIQSRSLDAWTEESTVEKCYECKSSFGMGLLSSRKHHCRKCGRVFCSACSSKKAIIPFYITKIPKPSSKHKDEGLKHPVRVCDVCFEMLENLSQIANHVKTGKSDQHSLRIEDLKNIVDNSNDSLLKQWANFKLSTFREIQYVQTNHRFSDEEKEMLWVNRNRLVGHNVWFVQLLKSIDYITATQDQLLEVCSLLSESKKFPTAEEGVGRRECWDLMCARACRPHFDVECAIQVLNQLVRYNPVREYALTFLDQCDEQVKKHTTFIFMALFINTNLGFFSLWYRIHAQVCRTKGWVLQELKVHVPYLVRHSLYAPIVYGWLLKKCSTSAIIASETFFELQTYLDMSKRNVVRLNDTRHGEFLEMRETPKINRHNYDVIQETLSQWRQIVPQEVQEQIFNSARLVETVREAYNGAFGPEGVGKRFAELQDTAFHFPTRVSDGLFFVNYTGVHVFGSFTAPVSIPVSRNSPKSVAGLRGKPTVSLLWKPTDIRKEFYIMNTIRMMKLILQREEELDLPIVVYPVRPCSSKDGMIEMVPDCISLSDLRFKGIGILPWLIEQNEASTESATQLRERFLESCASYCVITYLLGIGDRNLDNMLLRADGSLFHIDYGFILGQDPKPLDKPQMRITAEMLEALGGTDSKTHKRFQALSSRIYNCLRRHVNLFVCMLRLLVEADPIIEENGIIDDALLMREVRRRFVPGESYKEAEILIYNHIEESTTRTFAYDAIDFLRSLKSSSVTSMVRSTVGGTTNVIMTTLWHVTGMNEKQMKDKKDEEEEE